MATSITPTMTRAPAGELLCVNVRCARTYFGCPFPRGTQGFVAFSSFLLVTPVSFVEPLSLSLSSLPDPVQGLVRMVFDMQAFSGTLRELEIDLDKMPLGKLSKSQIKRGYEVLSEASALVAQIAAQDKGLPTPEQRGQLLSMLLSFRDSVPICFVGLPLVLSCCPQIGV